MILKVMMKQNKTFLLNSKMVRAMKKLQALNNAEANKIVEWAEQRSQN